MNSKLVLKLVRVWWMGVKVFCRWCAFYIVLATLALPFIGLSALVGERAGALFGIALVVLAVVAVPIMFYLTSKYLHLLGDDERDVARGEENPPPPGTESNAQIRGRIMKKSTVRILLLAAPFVFLLASAFLTPFPDAAAQIALAIMMGVVCGVWVLIIWRFKSFGQTPPNIQKLIIVLVCLLSILIPYAIMNMLRHTDRSADAFIVSSMPPSASYTAFSIGNLWIGYVSNRSDASSEESEHIVCSVGSPKISRFEGSWWTLGFSDKDRFFSTSVCCDTDETVWMDQQHEVTHLGPALSKNDVTLLRNHHHDENLKITYPTELLALVKQLKAEQAALTAPTEAASQ